MGELYEFIDENLDSRIECGEKTVPYHPQEAAEENGETVEACDLEVLGKSTLDPGTQRFKRTA